MKIDMRKKLFSLLTILCGYHSTLIGNDYESTDCASWPDLVAVSWFNEEAFSNYSHDAYVDITSPSSLSKNIVTTTKRIYFPNYPGAHNPSIVEYEDGYLMTFRNFPDRYGQCWISTIGIVRLNKSFDPISQPEFLDTRFADKRTPSQSEDARIISYNGKLYVIYNDNMEVTRPSTWDRRDMYIAEILRVNDHFVLSTPLKLCHLNKYHGVLWQKNWNPFVWNDMLLLSYTLNPHEVVFPDLNTGVCQPVYETRKGIQWNLGPLRGSGQALLVDGEYLGFFHSGTVTDSPVGHNMWHYFMGAYTFSADPPFEFTKISTVPIDAPGFYWKSGYDKRVIYPGGFVVSGSTIYLAYGKDDCEMWIATIDLKALKNSMVKLP